MFRDNLGDWFVLNNPAPGQWTVRLSAHTTQTQVSVAVQERSPIGLEGYVKDDIILLNQPARLQAKWAGDVSAISSPSITARVTDENGNSLEMVTLSDDGMHGDGAAGDGVFGAVTRNFPLAGRYIATFQAQGNHQGYLFTREAADRIDVLPVSHLFTGQFTDSPLDTNTDGKVDFVQVSTPVNLLSSGNYVVSADLYDAQGYFIDRATSLLEAGNSGLYSPKLEFNVSQANCDQFSEAFSVRNLNLTDAATFRVWDQWTSDVKTQVFNGLLFGCVTVPTGMEITSIQPNSVVKGDSAQVQISGKSFANGAQLSLGSGITVNSVTLVSSDLLVAQISTSANATVGVRDVTVSNPDGRSVTVPGGFTLAEDQPPSIIITYPAALQVIGGTIIASASVADDKGIQRVEFLVDGNPASTDTTFPYQFEWDTRNTSNGQHTLLVKAYDSLSQTSSAQLNIGISNSMASVSAASYKGEALSSESIVALFGNGFSITTQAAQSTPLPTSLAGVSIKVKDGSGTERSAPLFFVSPSQINYLIPTGTAEGLADLIVTTANNTTLSGSILIQKATPGLFGADASGRGLAAAQALRVKSDNSQSYEPISRFDPLQNTFVAAPIDLGPSSDQVYLILYGTGIRYHSGLANVKAVIGGVDALVEYAGAQGGFVGLDQVNIRLPRTLAGRGEVDIVLTVDGRTANTVKVNIK